MKKYLSFQTAPFLFFLFLTFLVPDVFAQEAVTDTLKYFDRFGNQYTLRDISPLGNSAGGGSLSPLVVTDSCTFGIFTVYYEQNSGFNGTGPLESQRRNVACAVFDHLSRLILKPIGTSPKVKIWVVPANKLGFTPPSNVLGMASSYYSAIYKGIIDGEVWKTINGGKNSYSDVTSLRPYHGYIYMNFNHPYHLDLSTDADSGFYDLYTVMLHEVIHSLGFASLIDTIGKSKIGGAYSRFDQFLTHNGLPMISSPNCNSYSFNGSATTEDGCMVTRFIGTNNEPTYAPVNYSSGSSLSHFDESCSGVKYVMVAASDTGANGTRRKPTLNEGNVFCDLSYRTTSTYGVPGLPLSYGTGYTSCAGISVAGVDDYYKNSAKTRTYTVAPYDTLVVDSFLLNDRNAVSYTCLYASQGYTSVQIFDQTTTSFKFSSQNKHLGGLVQVIYTPLDISGNEGNQTIIHINILPRPDTCPPSCNNFICDGGFEKVKDANALAYNLPDGTVDLVINQKQVSNGWGPINPVNNWCGGPPRAFPTSITPGDSTYVGMAGSTGGYQEGVVFPLNAPLIAGHTYTFSCWVKLAGLCYNRLVVFGNDAQPCRGIIREGITNQCIGYTYRTDSLYSKSLLLPSDTNWQQITFSFTPVFDLNFIGVKNVGRPGSGFGYTFVDNLEVSDNKINISGTIAHNTSPKCAASNGAINLTTTGGVGPLTYLWSPTGKTTEDIAGLNGGTHTVTITDSRGCSNQKTFIVNGGVYDPLNVTGITGIPNCGGGFIDLTITGGTRPYFINWFDIGITDTVNPDRSNLSPGSYSVYIEDSQRCWKSITFVLTDTVSCSPIPGDVIYKNATLSTASVILNKKIFLKGTVVINANVTFRGCTIKADGNAKVIIRKGKKLTLDKTNISSCSACDMWEGIIVDGDSMALQNTVAQGSLVIKNRSYIQDAFTAVKVEGGAILQAENSVFRKNSAGVSFLPYLRKHYSSMSYIRKCKFMADSLLKSKLIWSVHRESVGALKFVKIDRVNYIKIEGDTFYANKTVVMSPIELPVAVDILNATSNVIPYCQVSSNLPDGFTPCISTTPNLFDGVRIGVSVTNSGTAPRVPVIRGNIFRNVYQGVNVNGGISSTYTNVLSNTFQSMPESYNVYWLYTDWFFSKYGYYPPPMSYPGSYDTVYTYGIFTKGTNGFVIKDNTFQSIAPSSTKSALTPRGIVCENSFVTTGEIKRNTFQTGHLIGTQAQKDNRALQFKCGNYYNNHLSIAATSGKFMDQGVCGSTGGPAGNEFLNSCYNTEGHVYSRATTSSGSKLILYNHHSSPISVRPSCLTTGISGYTVSAVPCLGGKDYSANGSCSDGTSGGGIGGGLISSLLPVTESRLKKLINDYTQEISALKRKIDAGDTDGLIRDVQNSTNPDVLKNRVRSAFPLSDAVLTELIARLPDRLPKDDLKSVLVDNSPLTEIVMTILHTRIPSFDPAFKQDVAVEQQGISYRQQLEGQIQVTESEKQVVMNSLISYYIETGKINDAIGYLNTRGEAGAWLSLMPLLISENPTLAAQKLLSFPTNIPEYSDLVSLYTIQISLAGENRSVANLTTSEITLLRDLASGKGIVAASAEAMLSEITSEEIKHSVEDIETSSEGTSLAPQMSEQDENTQPEIESFIPESERDFRQATLFNCYPNPFSSNTTIPYFLPIWTSNTILEIVELTTGRVVKTIPINEKGMGKVEISGSELGSGIYAYRLIVDGRNIGVKKMTIID